MADARQRRHLPSDLRHRKRSAAHMKLKLSILLIVALLAPVAIRRPVAVPTDSDWRVFGRDPGAQRFSPLTQITPQNVRTLEPAWTFDTHVHDLQVTPIVVDGVMYVTGGSSVFALEPETGKTIWTYIAGGPVSRRGVAYLAWRFHGPAASVLRCGRWPHDGARRQNRRSRHGLRHGRVRRPEAERAGRRRRAVQVDHATGHLQGHRHHGRGQRGGRAQHRVYGDHPGMGRAHRQAALVVPHRTATGRTGRRDLGTTTAGSNRSGPTRGRSSPSMSSAGSSSRRRAHRRRTSTAAIERGRICTATRSSRWMPRPAG